MKELIEKQEEVVGKLQVELVKAIERLRFDVVLSLSQALDVAVDALVGLRSEAQRKGKSGKVHFG